METTRSAYTEYFSKSGFSAFPQVESEITFEFTIQLQILPFYEMKLNLSPLKCTYCGSDCTSFDTPKVGNKKVSIQSEISVLINIGT